MTRRVLITGGFGYLGGRVAQRLAKAGWRVALGSRRRGAAAPDWLRDANVACLDWEDLGSLEGACAGVTAVVHLAAMNEIESAKDPIAALKVNGQDSVRLLEAAKRVGVTRFVYLSTAHVYGSPLAGRIDETLLPRPVHPYAITHKVMEDFVLAARDAGKIEGVVLRLSNGFGAPARPEVDRWTLLVNDLCRQVVVGGALTLQSAGLQRRDFITLGDTSSAIAHALDMPAAALQDGLFNLGGDAPMRVLDMAMLVAERCRATLGIEPELRVPARKDGERETMLDYSSAKLQATGFRLARDHAAEIDATLRLCREAFGALEKNR